MLINRHRPVLATMLEAALPATAQEIASPSTHEHRPGPEAQASSRKLVGVLVLVLVTTISAGYLSRFVYRGWIPHDEGLLGHMAERVLQGELPHRDFDDTYTGGLNYLHAAAFQLFGVKLTSIRWLFFGFAMLFVPAVYAIALRATNPWVAGVTTLACVVWSVPNYFAALPSWYILFFTTFGILSVFRYLDTQQRRWLFAAGLCGGIGLLLKIVALYYIAAVGLLLVYREQFQGSGVGDPSHRRSAGMVGLTVVAAGLFSLLLLMLVRKHLGVMEIVYFVVPGSAMAAVLVWNEWREGGAGLSLRLRRLTQSMLPFAVGVLLPVVCFVIPYALSDSVDRLWYGVFVMPFKRLESAAGGLPEAVKLIFAIPITALLIAGFRRSQRLSVRWVGGLGVLALGLLLGGGQPLIYRAVWYSAHCLLPFMALIACWLLMASKFNPSLMPKRRQEIFLLSSVAAMMGLLQYPFAAPIYFCYMAPVMVLALLYMVVSQPTAPRQMYVGLLVFYAAFAVIWINSGYLRSLGYYNENYPANDLLTLDRAGLVLLQEETQQYARLIQEIQQRTEAGAFIYAAPDCPEVYFLSNRSNPTRTMYDFFDDPAGRVARIAQVLEEKRVELVVINTKPAFSAEVDRELAVILKERYPQAARVGSFVMLWREAVPKTAQRSKLGDGLAPSHDVNGTAEGPRYAAKREPIFTGHNLSQ